MKVPIPREGDCLLSDLEALLDDLKHVLKIMKQPFLFQKLKKCLTGKNRKMLQLEA